MSLPSISVSNRRVALVAASEPASEAVRSSIRASGASGEELLRVGSATSMSFSQSRLSGLPPLTGVPSLRGVDVPLPSELTAPAQEVARLIGELIDSQDPRPGTETTPSSLLSASTPHTSTPSLLERRGKGGGGSPVLSIPAVYPCYIPDSRVQEALVRAVVAPSVLEGRPADSALLRLLAVIGREDAYVVDHLTRGTYTVRIVGEGIPLAIFKPIDESRGMPACRGRDCDNPPAKHGINPELETLNEFIAAHIRGPIFDRTGSIYVRSLKGTFHGATEKLGILMPYIPEAVSLHSFGIEHFEGTILAANPGISRELQDVMIRNIYLCDVDSHMENILFTHSSFAGRQLHSIDYALCWPKKFTSAADFWWMQTQLARQVFIPELTDNINRLNPIDMEEDIRRIYPHYPEESIMGMYMSVMALQLGARKGLTPFQIGVLFASQVDPLIHQMKKEEENIMAKIYILCAANSTNPLTRLSKVKRKLEKIMDIILANKSVVETYTLENAAALGFSVELTLHRFHIWGYQQILDPFFKKHRLVVAAD